MYHDADKFSVLEIVLYFLNMLSVFCSRVFLVSVNLTRNIF